MKSETKIEIWNNNDEAIHIYNLDESNNINVQPTCQTEEKKLFIAIPIYMAAKHSGFHKLLFRILIINLNFMRLKIECISIPKQ